MRDVLGFNKLHLGIPNEEAGELPRAYVVLKQDAAAAATTEAQVMEFISAKVAHHKRLRGGVEFISQVPKSASGKILRRVLRDEVKAKSPA